MFTPDEILDSNELLENGIQDIDSDGLGESDEISLQMTDTLGEVPLDMDEVPMHEDINDTGYQESFEADLVSSGIVLGVPEGELLSSVQALEHESSLTSDYIPTEPDIDALSGYNNELNSIVKVYVDTGGYGSGVFLDPDCIPELAEKLQGDKLILTAEHVVRNDSDGLVEVSIGVEGKTITAEVIRPLLSTDLAFLRVRASELENAKITELPLAVSVEEGEPILQMGFPESAPGMIIDSGVVAERGSTSSCLGHTAESERGDSGGPIINENGEVIGVNSGEFEFRNGASVQKMSFGMNYQHIEEVIRIALKMGLF